MLCQLNDFMFESDGVNLNNIKRSFEFGFESTKLINDHADWQATGKYNQTITLSGMLIAQSNMSLQALETLAKKKKPVTLAFESGRALQVLILNIDMTQSLFLKNGAFLKQDFSLTLGVIYGKL